MLNITPSPFKLIEINFKYHQLIYLKIPEILRYYMTFHCRLTCDSAGAAVGSLKISGYVHSFGFNMLAIPLHSKKKLFRSSAYLLRYYSMNYVNIRFQAAAAVYLQDSGQIQSLGLSILIRCLQPEKDLFESSRQTAR